MKKVIISISLIVLALIAALLGAPEAVIYSGVKTTEIAYGLITLLAMFGFGWFIWKLHLACDEVKREQREWQEAEREEAFRRALEVGISQPVMKKEEEEDAPSLLSMFIRLILVIAGVTSLFILIGVYWDSIQPVLEIGIKACIGLFFIVLGLVVFFPVSKEDLDEIQGPTPAPQA